MKKEIPLIESFADIDRIASEKGPKTLAVLAPEDEEFIAVAEPAGPEKAEHPFRLSIPERIERSKISRK